jgi:hypothetical protein
MLVVFAFICMYLVSITLISNPLFNIGMYVERICWEKYVLIEILINRNIN